jgi:hypothetical protein
VDVVGYIKSGPVAFRKHPPGLPTAGSRPQHGRLSRTMTQLMVCEKGADRADVIPFREVSCGARRKDFRLWAISEVAASRRVLRIFDPELTSALGASI